MASFKQTEIGLIPEDWEVVRLGEIVEDMKQGNILPTSEIHKIGEYPVYGANGIIGYYKQAFVPKNKVLITCRGSTCGTVNLTKTDAFVTNNAMIIYENPQKVYWLWLYYTLQKFSTKVLKTGSGQPQLTKGKLLQFKIPLPPLPEQQKIAKVLDKIQQAIEIQDRIIEETKNLKKSLMKKLFTKGLYGEEQKETEIGLIPKSWEVVKLGDIFDISAGGDISKLNWSPVKTGNFIYPIYSNSLENNGLYGFADSYNFPENSITVTARGNLGYAVPRYEKFNAIIRLLVLIPKIKMDIKFFAEAINIYVKVNFEGASIPQLTRPKIATYVVPLPPLEEQKEIAHILSTVDRKIEIEQRKKEILKELFKTMLHKLMSGEIRLKEIEV